MREIKFRARTVATGKWIYFTLRDLETRQFKAQFIWDTVCEFTGLNDKNGTDIYESDILKIDEFKLPMDEGGCVRNEGVSAVEWMETAQGAYDEELCVGFSLYLCGVGYGDPNGRDTQTCCEIIGNVYENRELLDEEATKPTNPS